MNQLAWASSESVVPSRTVTPGCDRPPHNSLIGAWPLLEWIPKNDKYKEWPDAGESACTTTCRNQSRVQFRSTRKSSRFFVIDEEEGAVRRLPPNQFAECIRSRAILGTGRGAPVAFSGQPEPPR